MRAICCSVRSRSILAAPDRITTSRWSLTKTGDAATAIEHYRAFLRFGAVTHPELVAAVRARLTTLGG